MFFDPNVNEPATIKEKSGKYGAACVCYPNNDPFLGALFSYDGTMPMRTAGSGASVTAG